MFKKIKQWWEDEKKHVYWVKNPGAMFKNYERITFEEFCRRQDNKPCPTCGRKYKE